MYAGDPVLYTEGKDLNMIEKALFREFSLLAAWFHENELILNLKKEKQRLCYLDLHNGYQQHLEAWKLNYKIILQRILPRLIRMLT